MSMIKLSQVSKFYRNKTTISSGFTKLSLELDMGEFVVITGESGSGKSTLLNVISGLDSYEEGEMYINGEETSHYTEVDYENYRRKYIGNIFQHFNLVNSYTVYQNVELVLLLNGYKKKEAKKRVIEIIKTVGLEKYMNTKASKLSGGQKQRVAIARALAKDTPIIVADEPTGNLDVASAKSIMKLLYNISKTKLVVIVTHNYEQVEEYATRKISMHDGRIIEDKRLKSHEKVEAEPVLYKDLTFLNKIRLSVRNAFNIKTKFALLMIVYLVLTLAIFSEYSSLTKMDYDTEAMGENYYFKDITPERVILNKKDHSPFSDEELDNIKNIPNIKRLVENDLMLDLSASLYNDEYYFDGPIKDVKELSQVDVGVLPTNPNEVVIVGSQDEYYISMYEEDILNKEMTLDYFGIYPEKLKVVGIKYVENNDHSHNLYVYNEVLAEIRKKQNEQYSTTTLTINNNIFSSADYNRLYFVVAPNKNVKEGEIYVFSDMEMFCHNYSCLNTNLNIAVDNIYYSDNVDLKVKKVLNKDNFNAATGYKNYENYMQTIFISEADFNKMFLKDTYQISVFLDNTRESESTLKDLENKGYNTFYMRDAIVNEFAEIAGLVKVFRSVVFIVALVALFFISYFIIKIILKSRNVYYSTIRILGSSKKVARELLTMELLVDINIAFFLFILAIILTYNGVITNAYISDLITFFRPIDYVCIYFILISMSLLISTRYAHKLFKDSVMNTYREEV